MPNALSNQPVLEGHLIWVLECFTILSGFRSWSDGVPNPISLSDIYIFLDEVDVTLSTERAGFMQLITTSDSAFINHFADKQTKKMEEIRNKSKR